MLFNPNYGRVGLLAYPFFYFLETFGPALEFLGYVVFFVALAIGILSAPFAIAFFLVAFVLGLVLSLSAVVLEELSFRRYEDSRDFAQLLFLPILETFGHRQLNTWWRVRGLWSYLRSREGWGVMERTGFNTSDE